MNNPTPILIVFAIEIISILIYHIYMQKNNKLDTVNYHMSMTIALVILIMTSIFMLMVEILLKHSIVALIVVIALLLILFSKKY